MSEMIDIITSWIEKAKYNFGSVKIIFLYLSIISLPLFSGEKCNNKQTTNNTSPEIIITFEKTGCYGRCPTFKVEIYNNGDVTYFGKRFVDSLGFFKSTLPTAVIDEILNKADEIGFWKMDDKYDSNISDVPSTFTSIKKAGGEFKKIIDRADPPQSLVELEKLIYKYVKELKLVRLNNN